MKNYVFLLLTLAVCSCTDTEILRLEDQSNEVSKSATSNRYHFPDEYTLQELIEDPDHHLSSITKSHSNFISLMDKAPFTKNKEDQVISYYEALGYDTLVPNPNFARFLNPNGECEVGNSIIKVTPYGTFKYPINYEDEFQYFFQNTSNFDQYNNDNGICKINDSITLYFTFSALDDQYELISESDYVELPDNFFEEDEILPYSKTVPNPDIASFQTFSADRKTWVGKIIQNIIGSTKKSTIKFNKKRRVRGSFYFYNYGVYAEIGVQGYTDKKNWIGWSKTKADELRVG